MAKRKRTNNDLQNITKDWVTWIPLKPGGEIMCSGRVGSSCSTSGNPFIHRFKQYPTTLDLNSGKNNKIYKEYTYNVSEYETGRNVRLTEQQSNICVPVVCPVQIILDTTLCDTACQWLAAGRWYSPGTLFFFKWR